MGGPSHKVFLWLPVAFSNQAGRMNVWQGADPGRSFLEDHMEPIAIVAASTRAVGCGLAPWIVNDGW